MKEDDLWQIALKRADYALSEIANNQMNTWALSSDTPKMIIATQIWEAMNDMREALTESSADQHINNEGPHEEAPS